MSDQALVSVVIPTYNQARYLGEAIESVLAQDYPRLELIVVDDGSTDDTPSVLAAFGPRVTAIRQANHGAARALNRGIEAAHGDLVCWLSSDDAFTPGKLRRQVEAFAADPDLALCFTGFEIVDSAGQHVRAVTELQPVHPDLFVSVFWRNPLNGSTAMVRRSVLDRVGPFNERLRADVDGEMWLRVLDTARARHIDGPYLRYRVHPAAISANLELMRRSKVGVRLARIRDGSLQRHINASGDPSPATTLAEMSVDFTRGQMPRLAGALLDASRRAGPSLPAQDRAAQALRAYRRAEIARWPVVRSVVAVRRRWRARGQPCPGGAAPEGPNESEPH